MSPQGAGERVALLLRESDERKAKAALASQEYALRLDAAGRGDVVAAVYADVGYSGALLDRPAIEDMLSAAERGLFTVVRATEIARLSRGEAFAFYTIRGELARCGVRLEFLDQQWADDGESDVGGLLEAIWVTLPSIERRIITRRFKRGKDRVWSEGFHWSSRPPFGYTYVKGGQKSGHWDIQPDEAQWVTQVFAWAADGVSMAEIAKRLHRQKVPTKHGGRWWTTTVSQILSNPKYKGVFASCRYQAVAPKKAYQPRKGAPAVGKPGRKRRRARTSNTLRPQDQWRGETLLPELAIVHPEVWEQANSRRESNRHFSPRNTRAPGLLHGLVYCGLDHGNELERRMSLAQRKDGRPTWRCRHRAGPGEPFCNGHMVAAVLEEAVWAKVVDLVRCPDAYIGELRAKYASEEVARARRARQRAAAQQEVAQANLAIDNLERARLRAEIDCTVYDRLFPRLLAEAKAALDTYERVEQDQITDLSHPQNFVLDEGAYGPDAAAALGLLDPEHRQQKVRHFVERVVIDASGASMVGLVPSSSAPLYIDDAYSEEINGLPFVIPLFEPEVAA